MAMTGSESEHDFGMSYCGLFFHHAVFGVRCSGWPCSAVFLVLLACYWPPLSPLNLSLRRWRGSRRTHELSHQCHQLTSDFSRRCMLIAHSPDTIGLE
ncbi:hypothetical protein FIBSPDRAFT_63064 [Athelia psychrophila]|uniref:Uncharacterized protein n=1 Tax=Athelia psychrophila TaxID=1759441 RepID=A0A166F318_9AGAM|nr:hypothetical protein FIBSPDRAFT_63064 [Fibularhizoctonia sp. CBS 109695]